MTDPVLRAFREAARHGIDSIGEERLKAMLSKWLDTDGPAAFRAAADSGMIVRAEGTDNSGSPLWRLKGGSATALLRLRARILEAQIRVRALPAAKFRPRPGEKPDKDGYFWRSTDTNRRYRIREGDDVRETVRRALPDGGSGGSPGGKKPGGKRPRGSEDDDGGGMRHYRIGVRKLRNAIRRGLRMGSYVPKTGRIMDALNQKDAKEIFDMYTDSGSYVYFCAVTDNKGDFGKDTENAYRRLVDAGMDACVGTWTSAKGEAYNDTSMIVSGISVEEAETLKKKYDQLSVMVIQEDGFTGFIED